MVQAAWRGKWARRLALSIAGLLLLVIVLLLVVHTPPVRQYALRRAILLLRDSFNIEFQAERLDYNLATLRVALTDVRVAAASSPESPFLTAQRIAIALPGTVLTGPFALESLVVDDARVRVVRRADVTTNLPAPTAAEEATDEEPEPVRIGRLTISPLSLAFDDEAGDLHASLPALTISIGAEDGRIDLTEPGTIRQAFRQTRVSELAGGVAFDGRTVTLERFTVRTDEATVVANGDLTVLASEPTLDLRIEAAGDVARLARWAMEDDVPAGDVALEAHVHGSLDAPSVDATARSQAIAWNDVTVADLRMRVGVEGQAVDVKELRAAVAGGRLEARGLVHLDDGGSRVTATWSDIDVGRVTQALAPEAAVHPAAITSGRLEAAGPGVDVVRWTIDGRVRTRGGETRPGRVAVNGSLAVQLANREWRLDADPAVGGVPLRANLRGTLETETLNASTVSGSVSVPSIALGELLEAVRRAGLADVQAGPVQEAAVSADVRLSGTFGDPNVFLDARVRDELDAISITGTVRPASNRGTLSAEGLVTNLGRLSPDLPLTGRAEFRADASGPLDALSGSGTVTVADASYEKWTVGTIEAKVGFDRGRAEIEASVPAFGARLSATVGREAPYEAVIDATVSDAELARLLAGVESAVPIDGRLSLELDARGPLEQWQRLEGTLSIPRLDARVGELEIRLTSPGRIQVSDEVARVESLEIAAAGAQLAVAGGLALSPEAIEVSAADALRATVTGDIGELLSAAAATGLVELPDASGTGPVALLARVSGNATSPGINASLEVGPGAITVGDLPPVTNLQLRVQVADGWMELRDASGAWQGGRLLARGRAPLVLLGVPREAITPAGAGDGGLAELTARVDTITPAMLEPFVDQETLSQIDGSIDASVRVETPSLELADVRGELQVDRLDLTVENLPVTQRVPTRIVVADGLARVAAWEWAGQGATLGVQGQVQLADRRAAIIATGNLDLRMLAPFVRDAGLSTAGTLAPRVSVTGPLDNLRIDGDVTLDRGQIRLNDPRVIVDNLSARVLLTRTTARVTSLNGVINGGALTAGGQVEFGPEAPATATLNADIRRMAVEFPEGFRTEMNADLGLTFNGGDEQRPPSGALTGTVTVLRGAYREPIGVATGLLSALRTERLAADATAAEPGFADRLLLNVRVLTDEDLIVDNNLGQLQLGADLRVIGTAAAPSLAGRAEIREGGQLLFGRNIYTIDTGTIDFANPVTIEPDLDVEAHTRAGGEEIVLTLSGTPETLDFALRSPTAPELDQSDLTSLLLTGRRLEDVTGAEAEIVGEQVLSYLSGDALGFASRAVGVDRIRLGGVEESSIRRDPTAVATEEDPTSRVTFVKSIGPKVDLTYSQSLRDGDAQTWIVEYLPIRQVELRLVSNDENLRSYEFLHDVSFGGGAARRGTASSDRRREEPRVSSVSFQGTPGFDERRLRGALRLEQGDRFNFSDWQRDRDRLEQLYHDQGYYEAYVSAGRDDTDDTVALTYEIEQGPQTILTVHGYELGSQATDRMRDAWTTSVFDGFLVDEVREIAGEALARDGYLRASIAPAVTSGAGEKRLTVTIDPGPRSSTRRLRVDLERDALRAEIEAWLEERNLVTQGMLEPAAVERELTAYLRSRGYLRADVSAEALVFEADTAILPLDVEPGPVFTVSTVSFEGAAGLSESALHRSAALETGMPYSPGEVESARDRLTGLYRREGFTAARVTSRPDVQEGAPGVAVTFAIEEGARQVIRAITVEGNRGIDPDVVARAHRLTVGDPVRAEAILQARKRLFETGLFRRVDVSADPIEEGADGDVQPMSVRVTVQEWPALRLRYGFQVAEERPEEELEGRDLVPGLSADVTRRTVFGRAVAVGAAFDYQRRERRGRLFVIAPTMLGLPVESTLLLERSREEFAAATLITDGSGISWEQRLGLGANTRVSYKYKFERDHTFDTNPNPNSPVGPFDLTINIARLTTALVYDTRDDPSDASRGTFFSSNFEYAPEVLGSDIRFVHELVQAYHFRGWRSLVFASAARFGIASALEGQELITSERFFAGGARSIRGAAEDSVGPTNFFGEPAGGEAVVVLNQEVRFPIWRWFRGVAFVDGGNVFADRSDIDFGNLVGAGGLGLRFNSPFGLLRLDWARLFSPGPDDGSGRWLFGLGHAF